MPLSFPYGRPIGVVQTAANWAVGIAEDDSYGYSQDRRWGNPDYDCSSLMISAYDYAFRENGISPTPKDLGATYTGNMATAFLSCGFTNVIDSVNLSTGEGLKFGDVLLQSTYHTAMYLGEYTTKDGVTKTNQIVHAASSRGNHQGGDQDGTEIYVANYYLYSPKWDYVFRYPDNSIGTITLHPEVATPYVAIVDEKYVDFDYEKVKEAKISGMMFYAGTLYDVVHKQRKYTNPYLGKVVKACDAANMPYGLHCKVRARSTIEADAECRALYYVLDRYPPKLGLWLTIETGMSKAINDDIIKVYYKNLVEWGFQNDCGFYLTPTQLNSISWDKWSDKFYLMEVDHNIDLATVEDQLLTPEMFEVPD